MGHFILKCMMIFQFRNARKEHPIRACQYAADIHQSRYSEWACNVDTCAIHFINVKRNQVMSLSMYLKFFANFAHENKNECNERIDPVGKEDQKPYVQDEK